MADLNTTPRALHRRTRPSIILLKAISETPQEARSCSHTQSVHTELQGDEVTTRFPKTANLDFEELSFRDDQGGFGPIKKEWIPLLCEHLEEHYKCPVMAIDITPPYVVTWCEDWKPLPTERPLMIAGLFTVGCVRGKEKWPRVS